MHERKKIQYLNSEWEGGGKYCCSNGILAELTLKDKVLELTGGVNLKKKTIATSDKRIDIS